jgi:hypothetical protein
MFGVAQLVIVRAIIGLNLYPLNQATFRINCSPKIVRECMDSDYMRETWDLSQVKGEPDMLILQRSKENQCLVLALSNSNDARSTILATVAFERNFYELVESSSACFQRNSMLRDLGGQLAVKNPKVTFTAVPHTDRVSHVAYSIAVRPTKTKPAIGFEFLRTIPRFFLGAILITVATLTVLTVLFFFPYGEWLIDRETYINAGVPAFLMLVIEIGGAIREERSRKGR